MLLDSGKYDSCEKMSSVSFSPVAECANENFLVINNYIVGFTIDMISGNYINPLSEWYPNCEFMTNYIPFETAGAGCADEESD